VWAGIQAFLSASDEIVEISSMAWIAVFLLMSVVWFWQEREGMRVSRSSDIPWFRGRTC
jgi:hypothetical protein